MTTTIIKRDGTSVSVDPSVLLSSIKQLAEGLSSLVDPQLVSDAVHAGIHDGMTTERLDELCSETAAYMALHHPDYSKLAARVAVKSLHKSTKANFSEVIEDLYTYEDDQGRSASLIADDVYEAVKLNKDVLNNAVKHERDYDYSFFGFKTLERSYLLKIRGKIAERPQHMIMRVAVGIHCNDIEAVLDTYEKMSLKFFTHATPTLFNAGTKRPQMSSCFLLAAKDDSIDGIFDTLSQCAKISKYAGGIGVSMHNIRATGSYIKGTNGVSNGIVPMLRVFNETARYVDQCFTGETIVYTGQGPKEIKDVCIGDTLLSTAGLFRPVDQLLRHNYTGPMLNIDVKHGVNSVKVTPTHQIMAIQDVPLDLDNSQVRTRLEHNSIKPDFVDANELRVGDFVCYPIPREETIVDLEQYTCEDLRFFGIMTRNGWIGSEEKPDCGVSLPITEKDKPIAHFISKYLDLNGIPLKIEQDHETKNLHFNFCCNRVGFKFNRRQMYDNDVENNKIIPLAFMNLPENKLMALVQGIFEVDGSVAEKECQLEITAPKVMQAVRWMLMRLGVLTSGHTTHQTDSVSTTRKPGTVLQVSRTPKTIDLFPTATQSQSVNFLEHNGYLYSRIDKITETEFSGTVYDFEVDGENTYVTDMGAVHNGGGKRKGSIAVYMEPWHFDIIDFLQLRKNHGKEERRCRDLFPGLWIPDLFMKRVEEDGDWTLMCPNECPDLYNKWGAEFEALYTKYEKEGRGRKTIKAQNLWFQILDSQIETGLPYLLYKDQCNSKSNQQNIGTIKSSNLCTEILEYTDADEVAVCNLASIALPKFVKSKVSFTDTIDTNSEDINALFDFVKLKEISKTITRNLNRVIDRNFYPVPEAKKSNFRHRPIGLGVQGLADALQMLRLPFESPAARALNKHIFETIYFGAVEASVELAEKEGFYETFPGSPASKGLFQFDMWSKDLASPDEKIKPTANFWDWEPLRKRMMEHGLRNSLLVAPMPTASTSQILNNNESFEPYSSNIYVRRVLSGEFIVVNPHLLEDLIERGFWNDVTRKQLIADEGSVQNLPGLPEDIRELYKTVWEIKQRSVIDLAADRGAFIDQSQSLNLYVASPNYAKLSSMHFYGWRKGLKTGCYYLRTRAAADPIKFTVDIKEQQALAARRANTEKEKAASSPVENPEILKQLKAQLSNSLVRRTSRLPPVMDEEEEKTATNVLEEAKQSACVWRRKGVPIPEGCEMCSG